MASTFKYLSLKVLVLVPRSLICRARAFTSMSVTVFYALNQTTNKSFETL